MSIQTGSQRGRVTPSSAHKNIDVQRTIAKLSKNPDLKWRVESGLSQGFRGAALGRWLADAGFITTKGLSIKGVAYLVLKRHLNGCKIKFRFR